MLTEQGSDTISFILWYTSPGGTANNGLEETGGREARLAGHTKTCLLYGRGRLSPKSLTEPTPKPSPTSWRRQYQSSALTSATLKCSHLVSAPSLIALPLAVTVIIFCLILIQAPNHIQVITTSSLYSRPGLDWTIWNLNNRKEHADMTVRSHFILL